MTDEDSEVEDLTKEVYARFGLAYYTGEVLHRGLCNVFALGTFADASDVTSPRVEEKLNYAFSSTMGQLVIDLEPHLDSMLASRLRECVARRNFLAHHFWYERVAGMKSPTGIKEILKELHEMTQLFEQMDAEIHSVFDRKFRAFGLTDDLLQASLQAVLAGDDPPIPSLRRPGKVERIVRAWNAPARDGGATLIFEGADGTLWQLCDVGLGWCYHAAIAPTWAINEPIQEHLPASVRSRPELSAPWQYQFELAGRIALWVHKGSGESSFRWGLRGPSRAD